MSSRRALVMLLWVCLAGGQGLRAAEAISDLPRFALDPQLGLEHRRYLLYLYARANQPQQAQALADLILAGNPADKQTLLVLAAMYVERKEGAKALQMAEQLVASYPQDHQAHYFLGAAHNLLGHFEESNRIFSDFKQRQFQGRLYPYQVDLASAALQSGDWYRAILAYQELLRHHQLSGELRLQARRVLERLYRDHLPQISLETAGFLLKQGAIQRSRLDYQQQLTDATLLLSRVSRRDTTVDPDSKILGLEAAHYEALAGLRFQPGQEWETEAWIGGSEEGLVGNASLERRFGEQRAVRLTFYGNQPALDGLLFETLDGRENRVALEASYLFTRSWFANLTLYGRELMLDDHRFGLSHGGSFNFERLLFRGQPELRLGYRAYWMAFSLDQPDLGVVDRFSQRGLALADRVTALENLVAPEIHRQGVYVLFRDQVSGVLHYHLGAGVDYALDRESFEQNIVAGFSVFPRKSVELRTSGGYTTSARTTDSSSDLWQFEIALKCWF